MASSIPSSNPLNFSFFHKRTHFNPSITSLSLKLPHSNLTSNATLQNPISTPSHFHICPHFHSNLLPPRATQKGNSEIFNNEFKVAIIEEKQHQAVKTVLWVLFWASVSLAVYAFSKDPKASAIASSTSVSTDSSIKASNSGLKIAASLRGLGWPDEAVVLSLATLPVIELRGAIPVGYWMQLNPFLLTLLSIFGNMIPVPFIILYLKKFATFLAGKSHTVSKVLDLLFERAKNKAGPIEEFQWLGLMLFVAVPFPGTGAWTGAIIASVLDMPFWSALSANFLGVVLAGLLVNLLDGSLGKHWCRSMVMQFTSSISSFPLKLAMFIIWDEAYISLLFGMKHISGMQALVHYYGFWLSCYKKWVFTKKVGSLI
ncbi:uncharacterized protein LOC141592071 isoform X3 [Silene latifolia]|uniref:uncharacterized protein LOC141592071 isoform X3 n=1 Tax=Silene latifolia TaxID=37657 RepID=UPI003D772865